MHFLLNIYVFVTSFALVFSVHQMYTVHEWRYIDFLWEKEEHRGEALKRGIYDAGKILPFDIDKSHIDGRIFMTFVRDVGVPVTVGVVSNVTGPAGPLIKPFPKWDYYYNQRTCDSIMNVYRITVDSCNRLWMLDNGYIEGQTITCPPKLMAFDLFNDTLIRSINVSPTDIGIKYGAPYLFTNTIVETEGTSCEDTTVYIAESLNGFITVWHDEKFTPLKDPSLLPVQGASYITSGGYTFPLKIGVESMDVSPSVYPGEDRFLYYRPLASLDMYYANTKMLKTAARSGFVKYVGNLNVLKSQSLGQAFNSAGTLFAGMAKESGIACWNRYQPMNFIMIAQDWEKLEYPNAVKIVPPCIFNDDEELLVLSNRLAAFELGRLSDRNVNFRIMGGQVQKLIANTNCIFPEYLRRKITSG